MPVSFTSWAKPSPPIFPRHRERSTGLTTAGHQGDKQTRETTCSSSSSIRIRPAADQKICSIQHSSEAARKTTLTLSLPVSPSTSRGTSTLPGRRFRGPPTIAPIRSHAMPSTRLLTWSFETLFGSTKSSSQGSGPTDKGRATWSTPVTGEAWVRTSWARSPSTKTGSCIFRASRTRPTSPRWTPYRLRTEVAGVMASSRCLHRAAGGCYFPPTSGAAARSATSTCSLTRRASL